MNAMLQPRFAAKVHHRARSARRWYFDREAETLPRERLARLQLRRLQATLRNAYENVPLHRARMESARVRPRDVRSLDDVRHLPFTLKTDLRDHYPFGMFARPRERLARDGRRKFKGTIMAVEGDEVRIGVDDKEYVLHLDAIDKANIVPRFD